jgi:hypothetical protein
MKHFRVGKRRAIGKLHSFPLSRKLVLELQAIKRDIILMKKFLQKPISQGFFLIFHIKPSLMPSLIFPLLQVF